MTGNVSCHRYEDYLDSNVNSTDLYYLEDMALARQLVEFGYDLYCWNHRSLWMRPLGLRDQEKQGGPSNSL